MRLSHKLRVSGPLVVHCSAGIGSMGTFITIDVALSDINCTMTQFLSYFPVYATESRAESVRTSGGAL